MNTIPGISVEKITVIDTRFGTISYYKMEVSRGDETVMGAGWLFNETYNRLLNELELREAGV